MDMKQAAAYLQVSRNTLTRWIARAKIPTQMDEIDNRRKLVRVDDLDRLKARTSH